jgi:hypothetical protein
MFFGPKRSSDSRASLKLDFQSLRESRPNPARAFCLLVGLFREARGLIAWPQGKVHASGSSSLRHQDSYDHRGATLLLARIMAAFFKNPCFT